MHATNRSSINFEGYCSELLLTWYYTTELYVPKSFLKLASERNYCTFYEESVYLCSFSTCSRKSKKFAII